MTEKMLKVLDGFKNPKILVIGDLMLDKYIWGEVSRISPEAPIPVLLKSSEEMKLGGTGSVINNLSTFGAYVIPVSVIGDDDSGKTVLKLLNKKNIPISGIIIEKGRKTTVKTRMLGFVQSASRAVQHIMRMDSEENKKLESSTISKIKNFIIKKGSYDGILISDYFKGVISRQIIDAALEVAKGEVPVIVDPRKDPDFSLYKGVSILTPNRHETFLATGINTTSLTGVKRASAKLVKSLKLKYAVITLDKDGIFLSDGKKIEKHCPTMPKAVYDVSGAGDMVLATIGMVLASGFSIEDAVYMANISAGIEVSKIGTETVSVNEIRSSLLSQHTLMSDKVKQKKELKNILNEAKKRNETVVFTNGCFDIIHPGHIKLLNFAKSQGDILVIGLNSDKSVKKIKGNLRPILKEKERALVLAGLESVDFIVIFEEETPLQIIKYLMPDVLVKGEDWKEKGVVGREFVEKNGGRVVLAPLYKGYTTSNIIKKIKNTPERT